MSINFKSILKLIKYELNILLIEFRNHFLTVPAIYLFFMITQYIRNQSVDISLIWIFVAIFSLNISLIIKMFNRLHVEQNSITFLMLPASMLEKLVAKLVLVLVLFPLISFASVALLSGIASWINSSLETVNETALLTSETGLSYMVNYLKLLWMGHSVFMLGAIIFKKSQFILTSITSIGYLMITFIFTFLSIGVSYSDYLPSSINFSFSGLHNHPKFNVSLEQKNMEYSLIVFYVIIYLIIPLGLQLVSYLKLKEYEVK